MLAISESKWRAHSGFRVCLCMTRWSFRFKACAARRNKKAFQQTHLMIPAIGGYRCDRERGCCAFFSENLLQKNKCHKVLICPILCAGWLLPVSRLQKANKQIYVVITNKADLEQTVYPLINSAKQSTI